MNWLKTTTSAENAPFSADFPGATKRTTSRIYMKINNLTGTQTD